MPCLQLPPADPPACRLGLADRDNSVLTCKAGRGARELNLQLVGYLR